ncbi:hypothetical protein ACTFIW_003051 [Dictyostelium discoideum]
MRFELNNQSRICPLKTLLTKMRRCHHHQLFKLSLSTAISPQVSTSQNPSIVINITGCPAKQHNNNNNNNNNSLDFVRKTATIVRNSARDHSIDSLTATPIPPINCISIASKVSQKNEQRIQLNNIQEEEEKRKRGEDSSSSSSSSADSIQIQIQIQIHVLTPYSKYSKQRLNQRS